MATGTPPATDSEVEWQFEALDLGAVERWIARQAMAVTPARVELVASLEMIASPNAQRLADTYYDTADWRLGRAGFVLRTRRKGRRVVATMKNLTSADEGLRRRLEVNEPLGPGGLAALGAGPVGWRIAALCGAAKLVPVLEVRTRRRPYALVVNGDEVGELALDESTLQSTGASRRRLHLRRVEVEIAGQQVERFERFVERLRLECGLSPASLSKFEAGLLSAGLSIPAPIDLGPTRIGEDSTLVGLAVATLRREMASLLSHEVGTRLGEDIEDLHQMRVATRRLRAALSLFADVLPVRAAMVRAEIGWLATVLGAVRDLDVQLERTAEWVAESPAEVRTDLSELVGRLEEDRHQARATMLAALDSRRYRRLVAMTQALLALDAGRRSPAGRIPAMVAMPELIESRHDAAAKVARRARRSGRAPDFHRLRISCKRLRYALDFAGELYSGDGRRFTRILARLQTELGEMQDAEVAAERLRDLALARAAGTDNALSPGAIFAIGGIAERYRAESARLLDRLGGEVNAINAEEWRRLRRVMERRRRQVLASAPRRPVRRAPAVRLRAVPDAPPEVRAAAIVPGPGPRLVELPTSPSPLPPPDGLGGDYAGDTH